MHKYFGLGVILWVSSLISQAQTLPSSIATWKNNAQGAYTLIHDDFGDYSVIGINNYVDTMAWNRGIKVTFGAITSACEGNPGMYTKANLMISHGHEIINHSHTHSCAVTNQNCGGQGVNYGWGESIDAKIYEEIDSSTASIFRNTGKYPRYFIYPYDQFTSTSNNYLKNKGYIGSRTGSYNAYDVSTFTPDAAGFFPSALVVDVQSVGSEWLSVNHNSWLDQAIANKGWVNREMHNVGSSGWGRVSVQDYQSHLNYLKTKMDAGDVWQGTVSEVLTYQIQKLNYVPTAVKDTEGKIVVSWNNPSFSVANYLQPLAVKSPITVNITSTGISAPIRVTQNGTVLTDWKIHGNRLSINAYPHLGSISISPASCSGVCIISSPTSVSVNQGSASTLTGLATGTGQIMYRWLKNNAPLAGFTTNIINFASTPSSAAGVYRLIASNGLVSDTSAPATLTVLASTPFRGIRLAIPGTIEMEDFDNGGQNVSYNESTSTNEGDGGAYRSGPVDIEICGEGGYSIGYITNNEWLGYSTTVSITGTYDIECRVAAASVGSGSPNGKLSLSIDQTDVVSNLTIPITGGWQTWRSVTVGGINLNAGERYLTFKAPVGNFNINYIKFTLRSTPVTWEEDQPTETTKIYPIPTSDILNIHIPTVGIEKIQVLDLHGMVWMEQLTNSPDNTLAISNLTPGIYFLKLIGQTKTVFIKWTKI